MIEKRRFPEKCQKQIEWWKKSCLRHKIPPKVAIINKLEEIRKRDEQDEIGGAGETVANRKEGDGNDN